MNQNSGIPAGIGSVIIIDDEGSRTHYSPEEWRHKQVMGKLDSIDNVFNHPYWAGVEFRMPRPLADQTAGEPAALVVEPVVDAGSVWTLLCVASPANVARIDAASFAMS
jgi:hypothetical protein